VIARFALVCLLALGEAAGAAEQPGLLPVGDTLPDLLMDGLNGPDRGLASYRGRRLIINVWASWCGPCRAEAASLERFAWGERGSDYVIIGISTDDDRDSALRWLGKSNATISHYIDHDLVLETLLGASRIPLTALVDEHGRLLARVEGAREWDSPESGRLIDSVFDQPGDTAASP
jgi:thiol-disulfide isomerase/thioredoxin